MTQDICNQLWSSIFMVSSSRSFNRLIWLHVLPWKSCILMYFHESHAFSCTSMKVMHYHVLPWKSCIIMYFHESHAFSCTSMKVMHSHELPINSCILMKFHKIKASSHSPLNFMQLYGPHLVLRSFASFHYFHRILSNTMKLHAWSCSSNDSTKTLLSSLISVYYIHHIHNMMLSIALWRIRIWLWLFRFIFSCALHIISLLFQPPSHSRTYPRSLSHLSALIPAHSRTYPRSLLHMLMHEYLQETKAKIIIV